VIDNLLKFSGDGLDNLLDLAGISVSKKGGDGIKQRGNVSLKLCFTNF
jgi:hypothetical protein